MAAALPTRVDLEGLPSVELLTEIKRRFTVLTRPHKRFVVFGTPLSGKHTQVDEIRKNWGVCAMDGEKMREKTQNKTDQEVVDKIEQGMQETQCRRGFILKDFPQTVVGAAKLNDMLEKHDQKIDHAIYLHSSAETAVKRGAGRLIEEESGRRYHKELAPPDVAGVCDYSGKPLVTRAADMDVAAVQKRHQEAVTNSGLLKQWFEKTKGVLLEVDTEQLERPKVTQVLLETIAMGSKKNPETAAA